MDMLPRRLADDREAFLPVPGGAVFNTAVALGRLGEDTQFLSGLSTDMFGRKLMAFLDESGVGTAYCVRSARPTTLAFVTLSGGNAQYSFMDENTAGRMLSADDLPILPDTAQALHFGAISLIPEPCGSTYETLMRRLYEKAVISLDPNIRPGFVTDESAYRERLNRMIAMSDIIKVSEEDLDWLEPGRAFEIVARDWIDRGASIVTLTMGDKGARAITRDHEITVPTQPVAVVDTVGAGDTFNAGFLAGLRQTGGLSKHGLTQLDEDALRKALALGAEVAAYTVGQAGANPPWRAALSC
nr:carbohydrate kinase [Magnetospira sp. QH-2]